MVGVVGVWWYVYDCMCVRGGTGGVREWCVMCMEGISGDLG